MGSSRPLAGASLAGASLAGPSLAGPSLAFWALFGPYCELWIFERMSLAPAWAGLSIPAEVLIQRVA